MMKKRHCLIIILLCLIISFVFENHITQAKTNKKTDSQMNIINGMWEIESIIKGKKNKGVAYIFNHSGDTIKGYAQLYRLPGLFKIYGTIEELNIHLTATTQNHTLSTKAIINPETNTVSGSYISSPENITVQWTGKKITADIKKGTYSYHEKTKLLSLKLNDGTSPEYTVLKLTSTNLTLDSKQEWERPRSNPKSILGAWETEISEKQYIMVLIDDNTANIIIRDKNDAPPAKDMTGLWNVSSIQNNVTRKGRAFISMEPSGLVSGFAELSSLPGFSTIIGKMSDYKFTLTLRSPKGMMTVEGFANNFSSIVSGTFSMNGIHNSISWAGKKVSKSVKHGHYIFNQQSQALTITLENTTSKKYQIKTISEKQIIFIDATVWRRDSGDKDSIIGVWEHSKQGQQQFIVLFTNKTMMIIDL